MDPSVEHPEQLTIPSRSDFWRDQPGPLTLGRRQILELLHHYRYLTPRLLALAYGASESHMRTTLAQLAREGYVARRNAPGHRIGDPGSEELIYVLSTTGARAVLDAPTYASARRLIYLRNKKTRGNYYHHLALSQLQLILTLGGDPWQVETFITDEHRSKFHLTLPSIKVPAAGRLGQVQAIGGVDRGLQPDARVLVRFPSGQRTLFLFDLDLQRRSNARIDTRTLCYDVLVSRHLDELKRTHDVTNVVVVFVAPHEREAERLRLRARHVLHTARSAWLDHRPLFLFWTRQSWLTKQTLTRRQGVGTESERVREWTVTVLRNPRDILLEPNVVNLSGNRRQLIQSDAQEPLPLFPGGLP